MKVLIIEDDENKRSQLESFLQEAFRTLQITIAKSLQSGLRAILQSISRNYLDFVILDMTLPTYDITIDEDGGRPQPYGGREILRQLDRRNIHLPVIVVTQFDRFGEGKDTLTLAELDKQLKTDHPHTYAGSIFYNPAVKGWKEALRKMIREIPIERER